MAAEDWIGGEDPEDFEPRVRRRVERRPSPPGTWVTRDGAQVAFRDMDDRHLLNTIAFVERDYRSMQDTFCDAALDIDLLWPQHAGLVAEARRRGLIPKGKKGLVTA